MAVDLSAKSLDALKTILTNHEVAGKTAAPSFKAALAELGKRVYVRAEPGPHGGDHRRGGARTGVSSSPTRRSRCRAA